MLKKISIAVMVTLVLSIAGCSHGSYFMKNCSDLGKDADSGDTLHKCKDRL